MPALLNPKQEYFARHIAGGKTQAEAYALAGYAESAQNASKLANTPDVKARILELTLATSERMQITKERVLSELARIGFSDLSDIVTIHRGKVKVTDTAKLGKNVTAAISKIIQTREGVQVQMHDKRAALESLGKHLGLFNEANQLTVNVNLADLVNGSYKLDEPAPKQIEGTVERNSSTNDEG